MTDYLLTEAGGALLTESGGHILLESSSGTPSVLSPHITFRHTLEAAFDSLASDAIYVYTDLSDYLRDGGSPIQTTRGRQETSQKFAPGNGTFQLDNRYATFDSINPASPYVGKLLPMVPIRYGLEAPWLPGLLADGGFRRGVADWPLLYNVATQTWVAPPHVDPNFQGAVDLQNAAGGLNMTSSTAVLPVPSSAIGKRVTTSMRLAPLSVGYAPTALLTIAFYSDPTGATFISQVTTAGVVPDVVTSRVECDAVVPTGTQSMRVTIGVGLPVGIGTFRFSSIVIDYSDVSLWAEHFVGYSTDWNCVPQIGDSICTLIAEDGLKNLGLAGMTSPLYGAYLATLNPTHWYRLGETAPNQSYVKTLALKDTATGLTDARIVVDVGVGPLIGADGASPTDPDFSFSIVGPSSSDAGHVITGRQITPALSQWTMAIWVRSTDGLLRDFSSSPFNDYNLIQLFNDQAGSGFVPLMRVAITGQHSSIGVAGIVFALWNDYSSFPTIKGGSVVGSQDIVVDELWHQIVLTYDGSTNVLKLYVDGLLDATGAPASGGGFTAGQGYQVKLGGGALIQTLPGIVGFFEIDEFMVWDGRVLSATEVSAMYVRGFEEYPQETSLARIDRALDLATWPIPLRDIDVTRGRQVTHVTSPFAQDNALQYVQLVEDTEQGLVYVDRAGRIAARDHATLVAQGNIYTAPVVTFGMGTGQVPYESYQPMNNDKTLYTEADVSIQTEVAGAGATQLAVSPNASRYFRRSLTKNGLLLFTDEEALWTAAWLAYLFSRPGTQIKQVVVNPLASVDAWNAVQYLDVGMAVNIIVQPPGFSAPVTLLTQIQGIQHTGARGRSRVTYMLNNVYMEHFFQFGDEFSDISHYEMAL